MVSVCGVLRAEFGLLWTRRHEERIGVKTRRIEKHVIDLIQNTGTFLSTSYEAPSRVQMRPRVKIQGDIPSNFSLKRLCQIKQTIPILNMIFEPAIVIPGELRGMLASYTIIN